MKKIFITGGHYTPAKAVIDLLHGRYEIFYLGRKHAMEDDDALALEYQELKQVEDIKYLVLTTGRLQRRFFVNVRQSIKAFLKIFIGLVQSFYYLIKFRPSLVMSFGGYLALPVVISAWVLRIPVLTHEQTLVSGLANRLISLLATKIYVSWEESLKHFPSNKTSFVGNPVMREIIQAKTIKMATKPTIFITGGNQGSHVLNEAIKGCIRKLLESYVVIHQTGDHQGFHDFDDLIKIKNSNYLIFKFLTPDDFAKYLGQSWLGIGRSGANFVKDISVLGKPAVLIPIPNTSGNEQLLNAKMLGQTGGAEILEQKDLTPQSLLNLVNKMMSEIETYRAGAKKAQLLVKLDAAEQIVKAIEKYA